MPAHGKKLSGAPISLAEAQRTIEVVDSSATRVEAAAKLDISQRALQSRLKKIKARHGLSPDGARKTERPTEIEFPDFPDEDVEVEELLDMAEKRFEKRMESHEAHTWFPIKVKDNRPFGILWFGDPHIDDNGCNLPVLRKHVRICNETDGLVAANIGDTTNNWVGRLMRLYAEQDASIKTARRFAEWFLLNTPFFLVLVGNHDAWNDGAEILARMVSKNKAHKIILHDWEARFRLSFPNGWEPRIFAAHDFAGNSIWNPMHGLMREGQKGEDADLYVAGHKHNSGLFVFENPGRGRIQTFLRVRGYKFMDDHARRLSLKEQRTGCGGVTVFEPERRTITTFLDVEEGADFLTMKRGKRAAA
ncbi:hypothetical protein [Methyloceanibacter caenitepidi]|uniref:Calcineurin-like phosphoesterase domain-containing protein n=1 Tax=Methyloceanibacter caenitepidi TaxID=1384459 RepID=A0A0A8K5T8_9HYPH|nr:hypothetical protein [Methyloceanibacter caenitepidi]BAQ18280.1 hypothetical protein GL4_2847 [Methyloceanibacter caenitepidi]